MEKNKIIILDTSILCVWLQVPGMESCGSDEECFNYDDVKKIIDEQIAASATLVLPLATIIETGNHIAQCNGDKHNVAKEFADFIVKSINGDNPWALFTKQSSIWEGDKLKDLVKTWLGNVAAKHSFGDASIVSVANDYAKLSTCEVFIFTGDKGLSAYSPVDIAKIATPRRRRK
ncbi:MAG: hypothetical protein SNF68_08250 [Rikenellaceae bacterium]